MRLDGFFPTPYVSDRASARGPVVPQRESRAVEPLQEVSSRLDRARPEPVAGRSADAPSERPASQIELVPARFQALFERPLSSRASQALASYSMTAALSIDFDAPEVVGLDLYA